MLTCLQHESMLHQNATSICDVYYVLETNCCELGAFPKRRRRSFHSKEWGNRSKPRVPNVEAIDSALANYSLGPTSRFGRTDCDHFAS